MIKLNGINVSKNTFKFSAGELQVTLPDLPVMKSGRLVIEASLFSSEDIIELLLVREAIAYRYKDSVTIDLILPYMPYSRQDKVHALNQALSLKMMQRLLDMNRFTSITTLDLHSTYLLEKSGLGTDIYNITADQILRLGMNNIYIKEILERIDLVVAPDFGATDRANDVSYHALHIRGPNSVASLEKVRDKNTGRIIEHRVTDNSSIPSGSNLLIVDDICDGGATFISTVKLLKEYKPKSIMLYVTHGIFSKGVQCLFDAGINYIFTTNSIPSKIKHKNLIRIKV